MKFYHFTNLQQSGYKKDQVIKTDWPESNYWKEQKKGDSLRFMNQHFRDFTEKYFPDIDEQQKAKLGNLTNVMKYSSQLLKETIFELTRATHFMHMPSRLNCMFLFETSLDPDAVFQLYEMPTSKSDLIEVEILTTDANFLITNSQNFNLQSFFYHDYVNAALTYWKGAEDSTPSNEVLFRGTCKVIDIPK